MENSNKAQLILKEGIPEYAVLKYEDYLQLVEDSEMLQDIQAYDQVMEALASGGEELVPNKVVDELLNGRNPIRVWREYRGLTQGELSAKAEISKAYLSQLETNKRVGTAEVLGRIAQVLEVNIDDIIS